MSSKWTDRVSRALGLRLAAWYLATFLASTLVIAAVAHATLGIAWAPALVFGLWNVLYFVGVAPRFELGAFEIGRAHV